MKALQVKNLTIAYENKIAVRDVSFEIDHGEYVCVVGENGSGKSTLIKGILGLKPISSGEISFSPAIKTGGVGYLPQQANVQGDFPASVFEVVLSGTLNKKRGFPFYSAYDKARAEGALADFGIADKKNSSFRNLSGGQQRRVLLARALCATDKLLVLDEPVAGLDPTITEEFYSIIRRLNKEKGITIIMVTHNIEAVLKDAHKVMQMGVGMKFIGSAADYRQLGGCN